MDELDLGQTVRGFAAGQKLFDRYALVRILGRGGMGVVWLARDDELERDVALKFLPETVVHDLAVLDELKHETRRSLELTHHNIVRIYDFAQDPLCACISMEYVDGSTLSALRIQEPNKVFEADRLTDWIKQTCEALDYAHNRARIVHRDLKPANLMVNSKSELKVADFGIARSLNDSLSMLTKSRGTSGTLLYMSPQQLDGERASALDDIYSFGATLYELLTGKPPFFSGGVESQIREKTPPSVAARREALNVSGDKGVPAQWEETIAACLAKDPALRPQTAGEVAHRLGLGGTVPGATKSSPAAIPQAPRRAATISNKHILVAALAVLLITAAFCGWWFGIEKPRQDTMDRRQSARQNAMAEKVAAEETARTAAEKRQAENAAREQRSREAGELVAAAHLLLKAGKLDEAEARAREALAEVPTYSGAEAVLQEVSDMRKNAKLADMIEGQTEENKFDWRKSIDRFVRDYVVANQSKDASALLAFFAPSVDYFNEGQHDQSYIARDFANYTARWPTRHDTIEGEVRVEERIPNREYKGSCKLNFFVESAARREWIRGQFAIDLTIALVDGTPKIVSIKEAVVRRERGKL
jgi:serine/threonine protein kinase